MRGIWLEGGELGLRSDLAVPEGCAGEAIVRVVRAGICNTDLELVRGYYPYAGVLGHEFVGRVEVGPEHLQGRRVVGEINASCGTCEFCRAGVKTHCLNRTVLGIVNRNGAFAEFVSVPIENLHLVPETVPTDAAVFTEPLAAAVEILMQVEISAHHRVLVVGDGKLGQLVAQTIATTGCDLLAIGRHRDKLALLEQVGITVGFVDAVQERSFDIAIECTGNPDGFAIALNGLKSRGTLVMKSTYAGPLTIDAARIVVDELQVMGSRCGPFAPALELLAQNQVNVLPMIQARYPLQEGLKAFDRATQKGTLKVLIDLEA